MKKKIVAPILISIYIIFYILINGFHLMIASSGFALLTFFIIAILSYLIFTMVQVTKERLQEIQNEDDDIHKY